LKIIRNNTYFFIPYLLVLALCSYILVSESRAEIHMFLNSHHNGFFDLFFKLITSVGNGLFVMLICGILLLVSFRKALFFLATYLSTGIVVQLLKRTVFQHALRPVMFFKDSADLYLVEGVKIHSRYSFPSGHAATTFGFFICIALISENRLVKLACIVLACLVAYSRVYLSQHFLVDIYFGSLIGVAGGLAFYYIIYLHPGQGLDSSLISLARKNEKNKRT
jgi:membrane-associated phospholipid phosphatase